MALPPSSVPFSPMSMAAAGIPGSPGGTGGRSSTAAPGQMLPSGGGVLDIAPSLARPNMMPAPVQQGALQVASNAQAGAARAAQEAQLAATQVIDQPAMTGLAAYIQTQWEMMNRHRLATGVSDRLLAALRQFNGQYDAQRLHEIKKFGGSDVYARLTSTKCRGATSLLRDIYIGQDRPWGFAPPADVEVPMEIYDKIVVAVKGEIEERVMGGMPPDRDEVRDRTTKLIEAARQAAKKRAAERVKIAEDKVDTLLTNGNFYNALAEFLSELTIYPYAVFKGPTVRMAPTVNWRDGTPFVDSKPVLWFERVSPFDIWFSPGVAAAADAQFIERKRYTRAALNDLLDLPGYDHAAVRNVLRDYSNGLTDVYDYTESSRSVLESRENPQWNETGLIDCLEFHGNVQGKTLVDAGMEARKIPDQMRDYMCTVWKIGRYIIKIQLSPSPRKRHSYYLSSFEKVPGTPIGNALPDILADVQEMSNVALRSLANNMAFASGPQVSVDDSRLAPSEDGESFYPWKRWHVRTDPFAGNTQTIPPITFFQPQDNSQSLMAVYQFLMTVGDDASAVPRYMTSGTGTTGGASRTASGLAMLMGNAGKVLQTVSGNVDIDMIEPLLTEVKDLVLLTDLSDILDGTETIVAKGAQVATQRETQRARQLEFLQITNNPVDLQIMGLPGRAKVLESVSSTLGMPGEQIVPDAEEMQRQQDAAEEMQKQAMLAGGQPPGVGGEGGGPPGGGKPPGPRTNQNGPPGGPGNKPPKAGNAMVPQVNTVQPRVTGGMGNQGG